MLQNLGESVCETFNDNSIDETFGYVSEQMISKLDTLANELETKLTDSLKNKYPKYVTSSKDDPAVNNIFY